MEEADREPREIGASRCISVDLFVVPLRHLFSQTSLSLLSVMLLHDPGSGDSFAVKQVIRSSNRKRSHAKSLTLTWRFFDKAVTVCVTPHDYVAFTSCNVSLLLLSSFYASIQKPPPRIPSYKTGYRRHH
jgi:hypothetical protein